MLNVTESEIQAIMLWMLIKMFGTQKLSGIILNPPHPTRWMWLIYYFEEILLKLLECHVITIRK